MQLFSPQLLALAGSVINAARGKKLRLVTAESCTGGLLSGCLTEISGASDVFDRGFVVYSNDAKMAHLKVFSKTIAGFGAVSAETALEMAKGALSVSGADIAISVTGIAGPGGGSVEKPAGLVYIGIAAGGKSHALRNLFDGDRTAVRLKTVEAALFMLKEEIENL